MSYSKPLNKQELADSIVATAECVLKYCLPARIIKATRDELVTIDKALCAEYVKLNKIVNR